MADAEPFGDLPAGHRSGYIAIVGCPNVGKSTLLNAVLGRKIAAVSPKPQTTRRRLLGIKTLPAAQLLFLDTPGIHAARDLMNRRMVERALHSLPESDVVLWVVDALRGVDAGDQYIAAQLPPPPKPVVVAANKMDAIARPALLPLLAALAALVPDRPLVPVSARAGKNIDRLLEVLIGMLPEGPRLYPSDELTDESERAIVAEIVREKVMRETRGEVPYAVAVTVDAFEDKPERRLAVIKATLHVARDSQKPILLGEGGRRIKAIGQAARADIEPLLERRVFLELFVRVQTDWPAQLARLRDFGL